jgi:hypothetical protein
LSISQERKRKEKEKVVADVLCRLDIDSLKIQGELEEVLTLLSRSENNSISNIKVTIPLHTYYLYLQRKNKSQGN